MKSSYPNVLVYAVIVTFCCGMVAATPMFSRNRSKNDSLIEKSNSHIQNFPQRSVVPTNVSDMGSIQINDKSEAMDMPVEPSTVSDIESIQKADQSEANNMLGEPSTVSVMGSNQIDGISEATVVPVEPSLDLDMDYAIKKNVSGAIKNFVWHYEKLATETISIFNESASCSDEATGSLLFNSDVKMILKSARHEFAVNATKLMKDKIVENYSDFADVIKNMDKALRLVEQDVIAKLVSLFMNNPSVDLTPESNEEFRRLYPDFISKSHHEPRKLLQELLEEHFQFNKMKRFII